jgi:glycerophosphoryl diester phosphodiesterase
MRLIGHRGARGEAPENTLSGFHYLRQLGIRAVELDIQVSRDDELVVIHDNSLERTTLGHGEVRLTHSQDLAQINATQRAFPDWPVIEGIPALCDVMSILKDFDHIQFEVKASTEHDCQIVARKFPALWQAFGFGDRAFTTSFNPRYLQLIREAAPEIPRGFLFEEHFPGNPVEQAIALGCQAIGPHQVRCDQPLVSAARTAGLIIATWTVNDPVRMRELAQLGVDGLITDVPGYALREVADAFQPASLQTTHPAPAHRR